VLFPENYYYNSDALPIEWMEIFETKETLKELDQNSKFSGALFTQTVGREQIDNTEEPKSFLNRTIFGAEQRHSTIKFPKTFHKDFITENKKSLTRMNCTKFIK
jgi:hypothetical protein